MFCQQTTGLVRKPTKGQSNNNIQLKTFGFLEDMMPGTAIVDIAVFCRSFLFSQLHAQVSAGLTSVSSPTVKAFDFVDCSLSICLSLSAFNVR